MSPASYMEDKRSHKLYCDEGFILKISEYTLEEKKIPCPFCQKVRKIAGIKPLREDFDEEED